MREKPMKLFFNPKLKKLRCNGNSLTLTLVALSVLSGSMMVTSVFMGPLLAKQINSSEQATQIEQTAEQQLNTVQNYVLANLATFENDTNWNTTTTVTTNGIPAYPLSATVFNSLPASISTYTGVNPAITSTLPNNTTQNLYGIVRYAPPYENTIRLMVNAQAGATTQTFRRTISLSPNTNLDPSTTQFSELASSPLSSNVLNPPDGSYAITNVSGPFIQLGGYIICSLPTLGSTTTNCINEFTGERSSRSKQPLTLLDGYMDINAPNRLLNMVFYQGEVNSNVDFNYEDGTYTYNQTVLSGISPNQIVVAKAVPSNGTASSNTAFFIVYLNPSTLQVNAMYVAANPSGITTSNAGTIWSSGVGPNSTLGYEPNTNSIVLVNENGGYEQVLVQQLTFSGTSVGINTAFPAIAGVNSSGNQVSSTLPAVGNQASDLLTAMTTLSAPVVSDDGQFILFSATNGTQVKVFAMDVNSANTVGPSNCNYSSGCAQNSNLVTLMTYDSTLPAGFNVSGSGSGINGNSVSSVNIWYNASLKHFYWVVNDSATNNAMNQYLYDWDPITWGVGGASVGWANLSATNILSGLNTSFFQSGNVATFRDVNTAGNTSYVGTYATVRLDYSGSSAPTLWGTTNTPNMAYDFNNQIYYFQNATGINIIPVGSNPVTTLPYIAVTPPSGQGQTLAVDPTSGWLYYSTGGGINAYNPKTQNSTAISFPTMQNFNQTNINFYDVTPGAGNLLCLGNEILIYVFTAPVPLGQPPLLGGIMPLTYQGDTGNTGPPNSGFNTVVTGSVPTAPPDLIDPISPNGNANGYFNQNGGLGGL
jgi:hypothetical protein